MSKIDDPEAVSEYCRELGRRHVRHVKKGFQTRWWDTFAESLTECVIEWEGTTVDLTSLVFHATKICS